MNSPVQQDLTNSDDLPRSIFGYMGLILRRSRSIVAAGVVMGVVGMTLALLSGYVAESRFLPEVTQSRLGQLAGMAAQFGIDLGGAPEGESPELWVELLRGRELLLGVALDTLKYGPTDGDTPKSVAEIYGVTLDADSSNLNDAVDALRDRVVVRRSNQTGMIILRVKAESPTVAEVVNRRLLEAVNDFNVKSRTRRARIEREFVEARLAEAVDSLRLAETDLEDFLATNRTFEASARLRIELGRRERAVQRRQEVVTLLAQVIERARIEEVRTLPVMSIVDRPEGSSRRAGNPLLSAVVAGLFGAFAAAMWVVIRASLRAAARLNEAESQQLSEQIGAITSPFRRTRS